MPFVKHPIRICGDNPNGPAPIRECVFIGTRGKRTLIRVTAPAGHTVTPTVPSEAVFADAACTRRYFHAPAISTRLPPATSLMLDAEHMAMLDRYRGNLTKSDAIRRLLGLPPVATRKPHDGKSQAGTVQIDIETDARLEAMGTVRMNKSAFVRELLRRAQDEMP